MRLAEATDHRLQLSASCCFTFCQRDEPVGELHVMAFEEPPDELLLTGKVPVERSFGNLDGPSDIAHAGFGHALLDKQASGGGFDTAAGVRESMPWHVSERLFTYNIDEVCVAVKPFQQAG